ncbi:MAG: Gfo/Idh/MocA family oxidoreductase [Chloroflexota bacterium]
MTGLAIAGLGGLGQALAQDVGKFQPDLQLVAVQDVRADVARSLAERLGSVTWLENFDDVLARSDVDAVALCTPNALHTPQAQAALRAGKDVLVQKPLALSCGDAQATMTLATDLDRLLFVDYTYRFLETTRRFASELVNLGPLRSVRAVFHNIYGPGAEKAWFFDPRQSGGGALTDLGVHLIDLLLTLFQPERVELVRADLEGRRTVEEAAHLHVRLDTLPADLDVSWNAPLPHTEIGVEIVSQNGTHLIWENVDGSFFRFRTVLEGQVLIDQETTLREDTLRAFVQALATRQGLPGDVRLYELLDRAYHRSALSA